MTTTIKTVTEAREYFRSIRDESEAVEWIKTAENCGEAQISDSGDVHIATPQRGHWLSDDNLVELANAIEAGV